MFLKILDKTKRTINKNTARKGKDIVHLSLIFVPYVALIAITFVTISCTMEDSSMGSMILDIEPGFKINTILPDVDMTPATYEFHGDGPNSSSFDVSDEQLPVYQRGLEFGEWSITVNAKNQYGTIIAQGTRMTTVHAGEATTLYIPIQPVTGYGTLDVSIHWHDSEIEIPSLQGQLIPTTGAPIELNFTITNPGLAVCVRENTPTGYYTMSIQLFDNGTPVAGAVEIIRIIDSQTTVGEFEFYDISQVGGDFTISVTPEMDEPIDITLNGQTEQILEGENMIVTAVIPEESVTVEYMWFVNGEYKDSGGTFIIENDLQPGIYRLDVAVFTIDNLRAGSMAHTFTVVESSYVTLMWEANTEPDLAGYKLHLGNETGVYFQVIDVGNTETYTVQGLQKGETYYFAATAYNTVGLESSYSSEVVYTVPL